VPATWLTPPPQILPARTTRGDDHNKARQQLYLYLASRLWIRLSVSPPHFHRSNPPPARAFTSVAARVALSSAGVLPRGMAVVVEEEGGSRGRRLDPKTAAAPRQMLMPQGASH